MSATVFPKCLIGKEPQVTFDGYVLPCCWMPYGDTILWQDWSTRTNPFKREDFNLYNNDYNDIVGSDEWMEMLKVTYEGDPPLKCSEACKTFVVQNGIPTSANSRQPKFDPAVSNTHQFWSSHSTDEKLFRQHIIHPKTLNKLNLEASSRCTLQCPYCSRQTEKEYLRKADLSKEVIYKLINARPWEKITDCPRYSDPIFYKHFDYILDCMIDAHVKEYRLHVAATGKGLDWWKQRITQFQTLEENNTKIVITFGIDGLEETSKIHRIGQDWNEIYTALKLCTEAGIATTWQFIPFSHNEHQIEQAQKLAESIGCSFKVVVSNRFKDGDPMRPTNKEYYA